MTGGMTYSFSSISDRPWRFMLSSTISRVLLSTLKKAISPVPLQPNSVLPLPGSAQADSMSLGS
jgi:hypothetical protein